NAVHAFTRKDITGGNSQRRSHPQIHSVNLSDADLLAGPHRPCKVHHRNADGVAILGPRTVVVARVVSKDALQRKPGMAGALADAAVGDDRLRAVDADLGVDRLDLIGRLEGSVLVDDLAPRHVDSAGHVAGADRQLL